MPRNTSLDVQALVRPNFYFGQLITADDLAAEQRYQRDRVRRHNRLAHGAGVVVGLDVRTSGNDLVVSPGLAFDANGDEIVVDAERRVPAGGRAETLSRYLIVRVAETLESPVSVLTDGESVTDFARVREAVTFSIAAGEPRAPDAGVALARIVWRASKWRVDLRYRRAKVK